MGYIVTEPGSGILQGDYAGDANREIYVETVQELTQKVRGRLMTGR